ncbi:DUF5348 domain-containing protein [Bacillus sp. FJAT-49705]|uniref:DUF5348 domain-containing protein n=1 Tax=Cytobacillus citreus TaxID=2833586 RepID=A0ABS5NPJ7_9BACI|nr:DUF5348 domain-containing protein [Cytobacillus citreus]MBS4189757.1 DUF5348 domain-containing protein [Cytobacillus citreus]
MARGILIFDPQHQEWRVWIGQRAYWIDQGYSFELRIQHKYFQAILEKDIDWFVTLDYDASFVLHIHEVYKVRINKQDFMPVDSPF